MTKLSIVFFVGGLAPVSPHQHISIAFGVTLLVWTLGSELAVGLQCSTPEPWLVDGKACVKRVSGVKIL